MTESIPSKEYFENVAEHWDELRAGYFSTQLRQFVINKAYLHTDMVVADVGAGTGFMTAGIADQVGQVHVVDASPSMLEVARKNLAAHSNIDFHEAEVSHLPFPDDALDVVFANMVLHHCPDPMAAIREMVRVIKPGGRLMISDLDAHDHAWMVPDMADVWQGFKRSQIQDWYSEAGLVNILVGDTCETCKGDCKETDQTAEINIFFASGSKRVSGMRDKVQAHYGALAESNSCCGGAASSDTSCCSSNSLSPVQAPSCCGPQNISLTDIQTIEVDFQGDYSPDEQAEAPTEAASFSLGCGNPIAMAGLKPGEVVVDIGSGGGLDSFLAAKRVGPDGHVIGIDMTPAMLKRARRSAKLNGYTNVEFRRGEAAAMPIDNDSVDVIISNCVINLTEDKGKVFAEAFRILKPGGRLEISDMVFGGPIPQKARATAAGWSECVSGALIEQEMLDLVAQAGFDAGKVRRSTSQGEIDGTGIYSVILSAVKPVN